MVVPDHRERVCGMRGLQIRIELVQRVLVTVALQADGLATEALRIQRTALFDYQNTECILRVGKVGIDGQRCAKIRDGQRALA